MRFVLDTNTVIGALNRRKEVLERLRDVSVEDVAIPLISIAELFYGAFRSARREENLAKVSRSPAGSPLFARQARSLVILSLTTRKDVCNSCYRI